VTNGGPPLPPMLQGQPPMGVYGQQPPLGMAPGPPMGQPPPQQPPLPPVLQQAAYPPYSVQQDAQWMPGVQGNYANVRKHQFTTKGLVGLCFLMLLIGYGGGAATIIIFLDIAVAVANATGRALFIGVVWEFLYWRMLG